MSTRQKNVKHAFILAVMAFFLLNSAAMAIDVAGNITENTVWTLQDSPYVVVDSVVVNTETTLTIEPGVTVKFYTNTFLRVDGELIARGTADNLITFTSNQATPVAGDWGHIEFTDSSVDAVYDDEGNYVDGCTLEYCVIEYAGGLEKGALSVEFSYSDTTARAFPLISNCVFNNNSFHYLEESVLSGVAYKNLVEAYESNNLTDPVFNEFIKVVAFVKQPTLSQLIPKELRQECLERAFILIGKKDDYTEICEHIATSYREIDCYAQVLTLRAITENNPEICDQILNEGERIKCRNRFSGIVSGQILNAQGFPVPGVTVRLKKISSSNYTRFVDSDESGNFSTCVLNHGDYIVEIISSEYKSDPQNISTIGGETIEGIDFIVEDIMSGMFTQEQLDQAVADAEAAKDVVIAEKDQSISNLNQTIVLMFTQEQMNQAVANAEAAKDVVIAEKDQSISDLNITIAAMFTQEQLTQAVADAVANAEAAKDVVIAEKDQTIFDLTATIAGMFTHEQLDQAVADAVADAETAKDVVIAEKDQTITDLTATVASMFTREQLDQAVARERQRWDVNGDGRIGLPEAIRALQVVSGIR